MYRHYPDGTRVKVVALLKTDIYFNRRKDFIGKTGTVHSIEHCYHAHGNAPYVFGYVTFDEQIDPKISSNDYCFLGVKLKKLPEVL